MDALAVLKKYMKYLSEKEDTVFLGFDEDCKNVFTAEELRFLREIDDENNKNSKQRWDDYYEACLSRMRKAWQAD